MFVLRNRLLAAVVVCLRSERDGKILTVENYIVVEEECVTRRVVVGFVSRY